ncbi:leucyl aminopeptidase family protein [Cupriavidus sp. 30B13]|uniref:leucyl aminopeptidase family protein n=1 Tax=Cupriavidus sp. 30B13 TaxID=3384241 RepID=UPI003B903F2A
MSANSSSLPEHAAPRCFADPGGPAVALYLATPDTLDAVTDRLPPAQAQWVRATGFAAGPGKTLLLPDADGALAGVIVGADPAQPLWQLAGLPAQLPPGRYALADADIHAATQDETALRALGWAIGSLPRGWEDDAQAGADPRGNDGAAAQLVVPPAAQQALLPLAAAIGRVRRLVNAPANVLGPARLSGQVRALALDHDAEFHEWAGDDLPGAGFALVHAVGRAAAEAPRVAALHWGDPAAPRVVLVGKGVCFDAGGLDLKPAQGMRWMKKDMGGAAHAIALAQLVMQARLPVRLTLVVPAVENAVGAGALRPGDVVRTAGGTSVEIENTDAEGRLVLADALHYALQDKFGPAALAIDLATLTGAARVALGPELPALFSNDDALAEALLAQSRQQADPLWRLPLWQPYQPMLKSSFADVQNAAGAPLAGAITAALFLERFVPRGTPWLHLDLFAWNQEDRPGRPRGGEAQGLRALFALLSARFAPARA